MSMLSSWMFPELFRYFAISNGTIELSVRLGVEVPLRRERMAGIIDCTFPERSLAGSTWPVQRILLQPRKVDMSSLPKPISLVANHADGAPPIRVVRFLRVS